MFGNSGLGSMNNDVLSAKPTTDESRLRLIDEIKNRAKAAIAVRNYPEAVTLYSKAIELSTELETPNQPAASILYANRSMCYVTLKNGQSALKDAEEAIRLDSTYLKALFRKGMALMQLNRYEDACRTFSAGLDKKSDDKDFRLQLQKAQEALKAQESVQTPVVEKSIERPTPSVKPAATPKPAAPNPTASAVVNDDSDDEDIGKLNLRGYKKTSDGRTTSYFTNELDEETKKLIGNIAPQQVDIDPSQAIQTTTADGASVWNSSGTFESRNITPLVTENLTNAFKNISVVVPRAEIDPLVAALVPDLESISVKISEVVDCNGSAEIIMMRGKKKRVCDFTLNLKWSLVLNFSEDSPKPTMETTGTVMVADVTADSEYEILKITVTEYNGVACSQSSLPNEVQSAYNKYIKPSSGSLQKSLVQAVKSFCASLQNM